jgi:hypothetical protein
MAEGSPSLGAAIRVLVNQVQSGNLTAEELAEKLRNVGDIK